MKSEHRHELQTNELGRVADKVRHDVGGYFERHGNRIMIGICAVSLVASIIIYQVRSHRRGESAAWTDLAAASKAEDYKDVWETHRGTQAALWARVHEGEGRLGEGVQLLFTNVESAGKELKLAREAFQSVVDQKGAPPEIRERAMFGLARALEAGSEGSEADAAKAYDALLREFPATIYKKDAESRIVALNSGSGQEFYAWFAKYERPKPSNKRPRDRAEGDSSPDMGDLLNDLQFQLPGERSDEPGMDEAEAADPKGGSDKPLAAPDEGAEAPKEGEKPAAPPESNDDKPAGKDAPRDSTDEEPTDEKPEASTEESSAPPESP